MSHKIITIENCTGDTFHYLCPMTWSGLQPGAGENIRACNKCKKDVYLCLTDAELQMHTNLGHCVAVDNTVKIEASLAKHKADFESIPYVGYIKPSKN